MDIFKRFKKEPCNVDFKQSISTKKAALEETIKKVSLKKSIDLSTHVAKVKVAIDYSDSMTSLYNKGYVANAIERLLPLGLKFDNNKSLEVWLFTESYYSMPDVTYANCRNYIENNLPSKKMFSMGGTAYSPILRKILSIHKSHNNDGIPTYLLFLTDGNCFKNDEGLTDIVIKESAEENIYIQFIGIGNSSFSYLHHLDELTDRRCDNTDFTDINIMGNVSDEALYSKLIENYSKWVKNWLK